MIRAAVLSTAVQ